MLGEAGTTRQRGREQASGVFEMAQRKQGERPATNFLPGPSDNSSNTSDEARNQVSSSPAPGRLLAGLSSYIRVSELPDLLPRGRNGARLAMSTIWRWQLKGRRGRKLPIHVVAGVRFVDERELYAFLRPEPSAANSSRNGTDGTASDTSDHEATERRLREHFGV